MGAEGALENRRLSQHQYEHPLAVAVRKMNQIDKWCDLRWVEPHMSFVEVKIKVPELQSGLRHRPHGGEYDLTSAQ